MIKLKRYQKNPILEPKRENKWESKAVLNCAAIRKAGLFHLVYRAVGQDNISRLGYAISKDGFSFSRLDKPVFEPQDELEARGCEDPRIVKIEDTFYMSYVAYSEAGARVSLASTKDFFSWKRYGVVIPDLCSKDATLFPQKIGDKYVMLHRPMISGKTLNIWIAYSDDLVSWYGHKALTDLRLESWTSHAIGIAGPPIKRGENWLLIFHGVDKQATYRLGVALLKGSDPSSLLKRQSSPVLEPQEKYEREGNRPNVVFSCGICETESSYFVYYGAADAVIAVASMEKNIKGW